MPHRNVLLDNALRANRHSATSRCVPRGGHREAGGGTGPRRTGGRTGGDLTSCPDAGKRRDFRQSVDVRVEASGRFGQLPGLFLARNPSKRFSERRLAGASAPRRSFQGNPGFKTCPIRQTIKKAAGGSPKDDGVVVVEDAAPVGGPPIRPDPTMVEPARTRIFHRSPTILRSSRRSPDPSVFWRC